jgi:hypothetical protein
MTGREREGAGMTATPTAKRESPSHASLLVSLAVALAWSLVNLPTTIRDAAGIVQEAGRNSDATAVVWGGAIGASLGGSLFIGLVIWAVAYFAVVRRTSPSRGVIHLPIIVAVSFAVNMAIMGLAIINAQRDGRADAQARQAHAAMADLRASVNGLVRSGFDPASIDTRDTIGGEAGQATQLEKAWLARRATDRANYRTELTALGYPEVLEPQNLAHEDLAATEAKLVQAIFVERKYHALNDQRFADFSKTVNDSGLSPATKAGIVAGFERSQAADNGQRAQLWSLEDQILSEYAAAVSQLATSRDGWRYEEGKLRFSNPALLRSYNAHVLAAQGYAQQEEAIRNAALARANARLDAAVSDTK